MTPSYLLPFVLVPFAWLALLSVRVHLAQDRILRGLYRDHREVWESMLRPFGWRWSAPDRMAVPWNMWSCPWRSDPEWLIRTPELHDDFAEIHTLRRRMLRPAFLFAFGLVLFAVASQFLQHP